MLSDALQLRQEHHQQLHTRVSSMDSIDNTNNNRMSTSNKQRIIRILDPTCGSGTFLALALMIWSGKYITTTATATASSDDTITVEATGIDSNYKCARGTMANLRQIFGLSTSDDDDDENTYKVDNVGGDDDDDVISQWTLNLYPVTGRLTSSSALSLPLSQVTIHANDSVNLSTFVLDKFDCAVTNLPWNRNTFEYQGQTTTNDTTTNTSTTCCTNERILLSTAAVLKPGAPLVIISDGRNSSSNNTRQDTKSNYTSFNVKECLEGMGFVILGQATIPPRGFQLPTGKKKTKKTKKDASIVAMKNENVQRNSDCLITVAIAPG
jgi:SAM-dependent methyltransferase